MACSIPYAIVARAKSWVMIGDGGARGRAGVSVDYGTGGYAVAGVGAGVDVGAVGVEGSRYAENDSLDE